MKKWLLLLVGVLAVMPLGCGAPPPTTPPVVYLLPELKYRLLANFPDVFWTDPDFYQVAREGQEGKNALEQLAAIRADEAEFLAIRKHLGLPDEADYTDEEKLLIYREHKELTMAVQMTPSGDAYSFVLRTGESQGYRIEGTITVSGQIKVLKREPSFNTRPICLAGGTIIDTPGGPIPVERLRPGMAVWTVDGSGKRAPAVVVRTVVTPVPSSFQILKIKLNDGRTLTASAGHPTAEGRVLGEYQAGDTLDGARLVAVEKLAYGGGATYDLLLAGDTGFYWANGILLRSTLPTN